MTTIIDCIQVLGDTLRVFAMWAAASALMWLHDVVKARKKASRDGVNETSGGTAARNTP